MPITPRTIVVGCLPVLLLACGDDGPTPGADAGMNDATSSDAMAADAGDNPAADAIGDTSEARFAHAGEYESNFGTFYRFTEEGVWFQYLGAPGVRVTGFDNDAAWLVGQNASDDPFNPDLWSRFDFTEASGSLYVCQSAFAEASESDAIAAPAPDASAPESSGCGGAFAWTLLAEGQGPNAVAGSWLDNFGQSHAIDAERWVIADAYVYEVQRFDNAMGRVLARNGEGNGEATGRYSRFDWAQSGAALFYCQIVFDAASLEDADAADGPDANAIETDGCNGFPWSQLIAVGGQ